MTHTHTHTQRIGRGTFVIPYKNEGMIFTLEQIEDIIQETNNITNNLLGLTKEDLINI